MANAFTLFGEIKVDTKQFTSALSRAETQLKGTTAAMTKAEMAAAKTGTAAGGIGPKFMLVAAAATAATTGIYNLIKKTSDFGSKIFDASQKTGLSTETLSALKFAAEQSGASFEQATKGITRFSILMGEAASGSEKAAAKLKDLNVSSTDLTTGFTQAILAIAQMPPGIEQTMAASDAFGKKLGAELIPMIQSFDGNLPGLMDKLKGTGILMSTEAAQASDKFGDALKRLEDQVGAIGRSFAVSLMPQISEAMEQVAAELGKERPDYKAAGVKIGEAVGSGVGTGLSKAIENLPALLRPPTGEVTPLYLAFGKGLTQALIKGIGSINGKAVWNEMANSWIVTLTTIGPRMFVIGQQIVQGLINGVKSLFGGLRATMGELGSIAETAARARLDTRSPSKVFFAIGKDVAQGFIDGVASLKTGIYAAMSSLFDATQIKGLTKKDAPGVEMLTALIKELDALTPRTRLQATVAELTAGKYAGMNKELREMILNLAKKRDAMDAATESMKRFQDFLAAHPLDLGDPRDQGSGANNGGEAGSLDGGVGRGMAMAKAALGSLETPAPRAYKSWENFWDMMQFRMDQFRSSLPSMKEAIGENLIGGIMELGNVFSTAINDWIANGENFFKAIAKGFRQMVANIIGELVRLMVFQLLMKIIGVGASAAGGAAGGASAGAHGASIGGQAPSLGSTGLGSLGGLAATGGMASMMPAFAGGLGGGSSSNVTTNAPVYQITINGGGNSQDTVRSVKQGIREATRAQQREEWRRK